MTILSRLKKGNQNCFEENLMLKIFKYKESLEIVNKQ